MTTRLGLDIGTNSIGWCLYDGDSIRAIGSRIFSDGREPSKLPIPGSGTSLAVKRREARGMRRRRDRYLGRREAMLRELRKHGLLPIDDSAAKALADEDPYYLRVRALSEEISPYQLGRCFFHLNQRRGFKSNRKADRKSADDKHAGKIASATKLLDVEMQRLGAQTLGQFLVMRDQESDGTKGKRVRMRPDADGYDFYPDRRHVLDEFHAIWEAQKAYHPAMLTDAAWLGIFRVIEFQRDLKPAVVGLCTFAGMNGVPDDELRLPKAHPLFQQRRLYEEVNQLAVVAAGAASRPLSLQDRDTLILKLRDKKKINFKTLGKAIKLKEGERFNKESENRKELAGDEVRAELSGKQLFGTRWPHFSSDVQWEIIDKLLEEENSQTLTDWLKEHYGLDDATSEAIANARLPEGYGRFGQTATKALLEQLKADDVPTYAQAADRAGFHHSDHRTGEDFDALPYYGKVLTREIAPGKDDYGDVDERRYGKITNPTVHIGLRQLGKLVNAIIRIHGKPEFVFVELARELKMNEREKIAYSKQIKDNTDAARGRSDKLGAMAMRDSGRNRLILRLWCELNPDNVLDRRCPFCGENIGQRMIQNGEVEIEHIIPFQKSFDDSIGNKVLSHIHCNRQKGNQTPWDRWGSDPVRWAKIQDQVWRLHKSKQWRFAPDAIVRYQAEESSFLPRQLTDTQYLTRIAAKYLACLYPARGERHVFAVHGAMTAMLRRLWGLNDILPDHNWVENEHSNAPKNRLDHRHHAIDAAVVGVMTPALIAEIAKAAARAEDKKLDRLFDGLPMPWARHERDYRFRDELREKVLAATVSHKADHGRAGKPDNGRDMTVGKLHKETAYGLTGMTSDSGLPVVVHRIPLASLTPAHLIDTLYVPDPALRRALCEATEGHSGKDFERAVLEFSRKHPIFKGIRRLRAREGLTVIPIRDKSGRAYKGYMGGANALYTIWQMPHGKWVTHWTDRDGNLKSGIISSFDYHQRDYQEERPHPAAKKIMALRQNDMVALEKDGSRKIYRVQKFGQNGQIFLIEHAEAGNMVERNKSGNDRFTFWGPSASALQKVKTRQIRIDELGRIFDPGPR